MDNIVVDKSKDLAVRIVKLYQYLDEQKHERVMSKQLLRSGTSIGANIHEALSGYSAQDFVYKLSIALKEANETLYWLEILHRTDYLETKLYDSFVNDNRQIVALLTSIIKSTKDKQKP